MPINRRSLLAAAGAALPGLAAPEPAHRRWCKPAAIPVRCVI